MSSRWSGWGIYLHPVSVDEMPEEVDGGEPKKTLWRVEGQSVLFEYCEEFSEMH